MKKLLGILLVCTMLLPAAGLAEETAAATATTANAVAESVNTYDVVAPFAGVVLPFHWEQGDSVKAQDVLLTLDTVKVYAPATGTLRGLFAAEGDLCEDVIAQYGQIATIEKDQPLVIDADTTGRYDSDENKILHNGDTVYFEETRDTDNEGEGRITAVEGKNFTVEVTAGDFDPDDEVKIYREEKMGSKTCMGQGKMVRAADVPVMGSGRVLKSYYRQGQQVKKGQLLFELIPADSAPEVSSAQILAGTDGVAGAPLVAVGQQVYKGQKLVMIHDVSAMQVTAQVDEMDLDKVHVGDSLTIVFDRYPDTRISGTVTGISGMGTEKQNATYYDVEISFSTGAEILCGMNATVYLPD